MAVLKGMSCSTDVKSWLPAGIPLTRMMNLENRKGKANVPVIKKFLVDIDKPLFKAFEQVITTTNHNPNAAAAAAANGVAAGAVAAAACVDVAASGEVVAAVSLSLSLFLSLCEYINIYILI